MFKEYMVGRKNVDISRLWAAMPSTVRTTALDDIMYVAKNNVDFGFTHLL